ncbi:MAG: universal stress protein [Steroidobacteraceae bacterium]|nr:universal stress protein [Steroidobacteraceae bacterium]
MEFSTIAVAVDFSAPSAMALRWAQRLAKDAGGRVRAVHVVDTVGPGPGPRERLRPEQLAIVDSLIADARRHWDTFRQDVAGAAASELDVEVADRRDGLRRMLERCPADLVVLGATGTGSPNVGLGSFAAAAVRELAVDVLIVRDDVHPLRLSRVVVGTDFSPAAARALDAAAALAARDRVPLYVVHVVGPFGTDVEVTQRRLDAAVAAVRERHPHLVVTGELHRHRGARAGLVDFAESVGADLIAIGQRGSGGAREFVLGSMAEQVLRDSRCAVWVAKAPAASGPG